jgi:hypothetical protein
MNGRSGKRKVGTDLRKNNISTTAPTISGSAISTGKADAKENWWGGGNPVDTIFDEKNEPGIGKVLYEPFAQKPFTLDVSGRI